MYLLHFKSKLHSLEIENNEAEQIKTLLLEGNDSNFVEIRGRLIALGSISGLEPVAELNSMRLKEPEETPLTESQVEARQVMLARMREELKKKGVIGAEKKKNVMEGLQWYTVCQACGKDLPEGLRRVCSGACYQKVPDEFAVAG